MRNIGVIKVRENLKSVPTKLLSEELSEREGVEKIIAEPYQQLNIPVNGPAVILVVID